MRYFKPVIVSLVILAFGANSASALPKPVEKVKEVAKKVVNVIKPNNK